MHQLIARLAAVLLAPLLPAVAAWAEERPRVVVDSYPLAFFAEQLAGDAAEVVMPVPQGVDPSFWRPGIADIEAIQSADLILLNGAGFAAWTERVSLPRARTVDTSRAFADRLIPVETITHSHGPDGAHSHKGSASYTWLDQEQAILQAEAVADALVRSGLVSDEVLAPRMAALEAELLRLDAAGGQLAAAHPGATVVATHPRYQYLARAYGLTVHALDWEAGAAPDDGQLEALEDLVAQTGATVLLWEAAPPEEARRDVRALGVADVVFPTFAMPVEGMDYVSGLAAAFSDLGAAFESHNSR